MREPAPLSADQVLADSASRIRAADEDARRADLASVGGRLEMGRYWHQSGMEAQARYQEEYEQLLGDL